MQGVDKDLGTVTVGKLADVVVVDGDPLQDITLLHTGSRTSSRMACCLHTQCFRRCLLLLVLLMPTDSLPRSGRLELSERAQLHRPAGIDWRRFYERANALTAEARNQFPHHLDLSYGPDAKQKLDSYLPPGSAGAPPYPVFIFIHGGGFRRAIARTTASSRPPFAANGIATIVVSYRLHPHRYPDQVDDIRRVLDWTRQHVGDYGGNKDRVYIGGHSAAASCRRWSA